MATVIRPLVVSLMSLGLYALVVFALVSVAHAEASISITPETGAGGTEVSVAGSGFTPGAQLRIEALRTKPLAGHTFFFTNADVGADGSFLVSIDIPLIAALRDQVGWPAGDEIYITALELPDGRRTGELVDSAPRALFTFSASGVAQFPPTGTGLSSPNIDWLLIMATLLACVGVVLTGTAFASRRINQPHR